MKPAWSGEGSPYHAGEQAVQAHLGVRERMERAGRMMIRSYLPEQHRAFFAAQPLLVVGSRDARSRVWASILTGAPGFISSPDPQTLGVAALPHAGDPLAQGLAPGAPLGLLGIEFATRRRNRANGTVARVHEGGFELAVEQTFGNCPQYIRTRTPSLRAHSPAASVRVEAAALSARAAALVARADTFFIASAAPGAGGGDPVQGVDVSHRGGERGFVRLADEAGRTLLSAPDFAGNSSFNTFGNLWLNPRAGLLFVDFDSGDALSLTGEARVVFGAQRVLEFRVAEGRWLENACPLAWA